MTAHPRISNHDITQQYGPLIVQAARRIAREVRPPCEREELIGLGVTGLLEAHQRFDPGRGVQFSTFAYHRVRGAMLDGVRAMTLLPRRAHQMRVAAEAAIARGAPADRAALGRLSPTFVMTSLDLDPDLAPVDPDDEIEGDGTERVTRTRDLDAESAVAQRELIDRMHPLLDRLTHEEQVVIRGMYFEERLLDDLGGELGISRSWACRIHTRGLRRLRAWLAERE